MNAARQKPSETVFAPNLRGDDELANHWMRQAMLRSRREIAWLWHERGHRAPMQAGELPPIVDKTSDSLDLSRHWAEKQTFFGENVAARYLTDKLSEDPPVPKMPRRGSFGWVARELALDDVACFALGFGLAAAYDASFGAIIAACLNDHSRTHPNLMLIQRLWDAPEHALALSDPLHVLYSHGLLRRSLLAQRGHVEVFWEQPLIVPSLVARALLSNEPIVPTGLTLIDPAKATAEPLDKAGELIAYRLKSEQAKRLRVVPLLGGRRSAYTQLATDIARVAKRALWEYQGAQASLVGDEYLSSLVTLCWLQDRDLLVGYELFESAEKSRPRNDGLPLALVPVTLFVPVSERAQVRHIDPEILLPVLKVPTLTYERRLAAWRDELGSDAAVLDASLVELARRFRYERATIREIAAEVKALPGKPTEDDLIAACRAELGVDMGELAAYVEPRFEDEHLILPKKQSLQFQEQLDAMRALTRVHYEWGTAQAWNEGGITVLFAGPPGTGKTMAAEILARQLKLPMYRIDLSQVVNKYIGETEKNLKRVFDAAEISDMVLFFDEADSLFGKRTEVSDSRDRYANLEVSYLLERMERYKGLAVLATNRKRDLDEAFLRRIRYIIDFPVPEEAERVSIWRQVIPRGVAEKSKIDVAFLARQFPLSGGHIRSIVFNACLQSARDTGTGKELFMKDILVAVKREYDKMNRSLSRDQLGAYAQHIEALE